MTPPPPAVRTPVLSRTSLPYLPYEKQTSKIFKVAFKSLKLGINHPGALVACGTLAAIRIICLNKKEHHLPLPKWN